MASFKHRISIGKQKHVCIALTIYMLSVGFSALKFVLMRGLLYQKIALVSALEALIFWWILPFLIVYKLECKDWRSLGLAVRREKRLVYTIYVAAGIYLFGSQEYLAVGNYPHFHERLSGPDHSNNRGIGGIVD